jgi:hypothetical protein
MRGTLRALAHAPSGRPDPGGSSDERRTLRLLPDAEIGPYVGAGFTSYTAGPSSDTGDIPDAAGPTAIAGVWLNRHGGTSYSLETRFGFSGVSKFTALLAVTF